MSNKLISNLNKYKTNINKGITNFNKMFGISASVYRIIGEEGKKLIKVFGASRVTIKDYSQITFIKEIYSMAFPTELYKSLHTNSTELDLIIADNDLIQGDIIRFTFVDGNNVDYFVADLPETWGTSFFKYRLVSNFNVIQRKI